jgi:hypothetical protein
MRAQATGVLAQNVSTITAGLMTDVSAAVANDQDASGAITATLGGPNFTITGTAADGTLSTDSNIAVASATSTSATNRLTLTSDTSIDGAGATAATTDTLTVATAGDFSSSDAITLLNRQTSSAAVGSSISGDADMGDDEEEMVDVEVDGEEMMEAVQLQKVSVTHGDNGAQTKSPVTANSGAKGMDSKPVKFSGHDESVPNGPKGPSNEYSKKEGDLPGAGSFKNVPGGKAKVDLSAAPKPVTKDGSANSKSPVAKG